jgi:hypothetical protein
VGIKLKEEKGTKCKKKRLRMAWEIAPHESKTHCSCVSSI